MMLHTPMATRFAPIMIAAALLIVVGLAGCDHDPAREASLAGLSDVETRNPIRVVEKQHRLELPVAATDEGGGARLEATRFLHQYRRTGGHHLLVSMPRGAGHGAILDAVHHAIRSAGIADGRVAYRTHEAADQTIRLTYTRIAAVTQPCGDWSANADLVRDNLPYPNFGCAVQSNLAVMIAKPTDALYPTPESPRSAERRGADQKKYNEGTLTPRTDATINTR